MGGHQAGEEPVAAAAPSLGYRVRKLLRRNRKAVTVAAVIAGLLLGGVVVSSHLALLAREKAHQAKDSQAHAEQAEREAQGREILRQAATEAEQQRRAAEQAATPPTQNTAPTPSSNSPRYMQAIQDARDLRDESNP